MLSFAERAILHRKGKIAFCLQSDDAHAHRLIQILKTAAKRRKGAGNEVPCWGLGQSPNRPPTRSMKKQKSGSEAIPDCGRAYENKRIKQGWLAELQNSASHPLFRMNFK